MTETGIIVFSRETAIAAFRAAGFGISDCTLRRTDAAVWELVSPRGRLIASVSASGKVA